MIRGLFLTLAVAASLIGAAAVPGLAGVRVVMGPSWQGRPDKLQGIVDAAYGPGRIRVDTDYVGADTGEPDPVVWLSSKSPILQVREISGRDHRDALGWYIETGSAVAPVIDGVDDGPVFKKGTPSSATTVLHFRVRGRQVGFYLRSEDAGSGQGPQTFFTNRGFNDVGPGGSGAVHDPHDGGDVQALVFDVSRWSRPDTWLVCFESRDSGAHPGPCCGTTDNDYADYVFEVRGEGATTPTMAASFGALKRIYR